MSRALVRNSAALVALALAPGCVSTTTDESEWKLRYAADFADPSSVEDFTFSDPEAWRWALADEMGTLELFQASAYEPPHRSPKSIALIPGVRTADFDMEVRLQQTGVEYGHRDLCLVFGYQSPSEFYYVHLATTPDANAHNVFLVNQAPRRPLADVPEHGVEWGQDEWHRVRLERRSADGSIRVYWDDGAEPILSATDTTFAWGRVGFGSFDDTGRITEVRLWAAPGKR